MMMPPMISESSVSGALPASKTPLALRTMFVDNIIPWHWQVIAGAAILGVFIFLYLHTILFFFFFSIPYLDLNDKLIFSLKPVPMSLCALQPLLPPPLQGPRPGSMVRLSVSLRLVPAVRQHNPGLQRPPQKVWPRRSRRPRPSIHFSSRRLERRVPETR